MKLPRIRFTVRRLMIAVVIAAIATWQWIGWRRQPRYRRLAAIYAAKECMARDMPFWAMSADSTSITVKTKVIYRTMPSDGPFHFKGANLEYYAEMAQKYKRATWLPFLPVAPDPPEPE